MSNSSTQRIRALRCIFVCTSCCCCYVYLSACEFIRCCRFLIVNRWLRRQNFLGQAVRVTEGLVRLCWVVHVVAVVAFDVVVGCCCWAHVHVLVHGLLTMLAAFAVLVELRMVSATSDSVAALVLAYVESDALSWIVFGITLMGWEICFDCILICPM